MKEMKLVFYNGFNNPKSIDLEDVVVSSNYLGDVTNELKEEYLFYMENWSREDLIENQPLFADFGVWIEPPVEQLREYNRSLTLDEDMYLKEFIESEGV